MITIRLSSLLLLPGDAAAVPTYQFCLTSLVSCYAGCV